MVLRTQRYLWRLVDDLNPEEKVSTGIERQLEENRRRSSQESCRKSEEIQDSSVG